MDHPVVAAVEDHRAAVLVGAGKRADRVGETVVAVWRGIERRHVHQRGRGPDDGPQLLRTDQRDQARRGGRHVHVRPKNRFVRGRERDDGSSARAVRNEGIDVARVRVLGRPCSAGELRPSIQIRPEARTVVHELPSRGLGGVGDRAVDAKRAEHTLEPGERESRGEHDVAALRQRLTAGVRGDVGVRQRRAGGVGRSVQIDGADDRADREELAGGARIEVTRTREPGLHGVVDVRGDLRGARDLRVASTAVGGDRLQLRFVACRRLDRDDMDRDAPGHAGRGHVHER